MSIPLRQERAPIRGLRLLDLQGDGALRDNGGNGVLVDHLLFAVRDQNDHKGVKAGDHAPQLVAVHQKDHQIDVAAAGLSQKAVLNVHGFHTYNAPFYVWVGSAKRETAFDAETAPETAAPRVTSNKGAAASSSQTPVRSVRLHGEHPLPFVARPPPTETAVSVGKGAAAK